MEKSIKEKANQLKIIKEKNKIVQEEVNNLENIYQLSLEKEKIREEIEQKMTINKNNENKKNEEKNENKQENEPADNIINKKNKRNIRDNNIEEQNKYGLPGTREEQLILIKKKYMEEEGNNNKHNIDNENNEEIENDENNEYNNLENNLDDNNENIKNGEEDIGEIDYDALKLEQVPFKI